MWVRLVKGILALHLPYESVHVLEAGTSLKADVVPCTGAVVLGVKEFLDASEVLVNAEPQLAGCFPFGEHTIRW